MSAERRIALGKSLPSYQAAPSDDNIRIDALTTSSERWGVSADENVRTQLLRDYAAHMTTAEAEYAYMQRSHQGLLAYATNSDVVSKIYGKPIKKAKTPIAAHTPGLKNEVSPGTKGALAAEHGTRDVLRAGVVEKTLADAHRTTHDTGMIGKAATLQLLMSPAEELASIAPTVTASGASAVHSVLNGIGTVSSPVGFARLQEAVQDLREYEKLELASEMRRHGRGAAVPTEHRELLDKTNGDPAAALELLRKESHDPGSTYTFNNASYSQTGRLDQHSFREIHEAAQNSQPYPRPLSPPRRLVRKTKQPFIG